MADLKDLLEKNRNWSEKLRELDPEYFSRLTGQQNPRYLWIGCADSRVPANQIIDLPPGEVFVHRNVANLVVHTDLNCLSVIQYALDVLHVEHILVVGHYGCGGIKAAMDGGEHGLVDNWLRHIKDTCRLYKDEIGTLPLSERVDRVCELNVREQVKHVCETSVVRHTWREGRPLTVHGWVYSLENGLVNDLDISIGSLGEYQEFRKTLME